MLSWKSFQPCVWMTMLQRSQLGHWKRYVFFFTCFLKNILFAISSSSHNILYFFLCCTFGTHGDQHKKLFPFMLLDELQMFSKGTMWPAWRVFYIPWTHSCCRDTFIIQSGNKAIAETNMSSECQRVLTSFCISGNDTSINAHPTTYISHPAFDPCADRNLNGSLCS